jgi:release factor glutamine methyltransferase
LSVSPFSIKALLAAAKAELASSVDSPQLDAELLLACVLQTSRAYLHAWPEKIISELHAKQFHDHIAKRLSGMPVAYITGTKEFWSLEFHVTPDTLIPRPETELLIEAILQHYPKEKKIILADLGTGSGAIAIALAHERPHWEVHATDLNEKTLQIAKQNAAKLKVNNIHFHQGSWCAALPAIKFDAIVSNPPYISDSEWIEYAKGLTCEPIGALLAANNGLACFEEIIESAKSFLQSGGYLFFEHGFSQGKDVRALLLAANYTHVQTLCDLALKERVTLATY